jgi:hypothetical protein
LTVCRRSETPEATHPHEGFPWQLCAELPTHRSRAASNARCLPDASGQGLPAMHVLLWLPAAAMASRQRLRIQGMLPCIQGML